MYEMSPESIEAQTALSAVVAELNEMHAEDGFVKELQDLKMQFESGALSPKEVVIQAEAIRDRALEEAHTTQSQAA